VILEQLPAPQQRALAKGAPYRAHIVITHKCNLACAHCYQAEHDSEDLSVAELTTVFDALARMGTLFLTLGGGEPLARRDFWELLAAARARKFVVDLYTNGTLVDASVAARLKAAGVVRVTVSLHGGHAETHDAFVRRTGSFDRVNRAIDLLEAAGLPVEVKSNVTTLNRRELPGLVTKLAGRPLVQFKRAIQLYARDDGDTATTRRFRLTEPQEREVIRAQFAGQGKARLTQLAADVAKTLGKRSDEVMPCQAARTAFALHPNGDVTPCTVTGELVMGNVRQRPIEQIWSDSGVGTQFRAISHQAFQDVREECQRCEYRKLCLRCPALAKSETGSLTGYSVQVCQSTKVYWSEAERRAAELEVAFPREAVS
jgi:radical SAM protein with 4Fe4S-binding SPASM domain